MSFPIAFNAYDHNFCESTIYSTGRHPEYFNAVSSLFISFIGVYGLYRSPIRYMHFYALVVNGITSCLYHWFNSIGFGLLDRMSMIIIAMTSTTIILSCLKLRSGSTDFASVVYFTGMFTLAGLHMEGEFNILFSGFLMGILYTVYHLRQNCRQLQVPDGIVDIAIRGAKCIILSGLFWILTENLCFNLAFIKFLFGHVWWHIGVSYGGYLLTIVPTFIFLKQHGGLVELKYNALGMPYLIRYRSKSGEV